jgi:HK97 family phage major capsid protein
MALGEQHKCSELAMKAIREGRSVDDFRGEILETVYKAKSVALPDPNIGLSRKEIKQWSMVRTIAAQMNGRPQDAPFEYECSQAVAERLHKSPQGMFVPYDVMDTPVQDGSTRDSATWERLTRLLATRDLSKGTWNAGGAMVATEVLTASFIELLRNKMVLRTLGATFLGGLVGDVAIPKQTGGATAYWVSEGTAPTESQQTIGQVGLTPKTVGAFTDFTRKLMLQSSMDVEAFVRNDLALVLAIAKDLAGIAGQGVNGQPRGIFAHPDVSTVAISTNGNSASWGNIVGLETQVATNNADIGAMAYLFNAAGRGLLKQVPKVSSYPVFLWEGNEVNGYPAYVSNQVPSNLEKGSGTSLSGGVFGVWSQLIVADWGTVDILVDPYTASSSGTIRVRALSDCDIGLRYGQAFAVFRDLKTS